MYTGKLEIPAEPAPPSPQQRPRNSPIPPNRQMVWGTPRSQEQRFSSNYYGPGESSILSQSPSQPVICKGLVTAAAVYVISEKYDIQLLKALAKTKYDSLLKTGWASEHFVQSLKIIYEGTPDTTPPDQLRVVASKAAGQNAQVLLQNDEFKNLLRGRGDLATDVLVASLEPEPYQRRY
jgi:hypothetical protein